MATGTRCVCAGLVLLGLTSTPLAQAPEGPSGWTAKATQYAARDMVAAAHPLAVDAGVRILCAPAFLRKRARTSTPPHDGLDHLSETKSWTTFSLPRPLTRSAQSSGVLPAPALPSIADALGIVHRSLRHQR